MKALQLKNHTEHWKLDNTANIQYKTQCTMQGVYIEFKPQPKFKPPEQNWVFARRLYKNISVIVQNESRLCNHKQYIYVYI